MRCLYSALHLSGELIDHVPERGSIYPRGEHTYAPKEDMVSLGPEVDFEARTILCGPFLTLTRNVQTSQTGRSSNVDHTQASPRKGKLHTLKWHEWSVSLVGEL